MSSKTLVVSLCAAAVLIVSPISVQAEEELAPGFNVCIKKADSTVAHIECLNAAYQYWDKILNNNYASALKSCKSQENPDQCKKTIKDAQLKWIKYKEAMVDVIYARGGGGSLDGLAAASFTTQETKRQALLLQQ